MEVTSTVEADILALDIPAAGAGLTITGTLDVPVGRGEVQGIVVTVLNGVWTEINDIRVTLAQNGENIIQSVNSSNFYFDNNTKPALIPATITEGSTIDYTVVNGGAASVAHKVYLVYNIGIYSAVDDLIDMAKTKGSKLLRSSYFITCGATTTVVLNQAAPSRHGPVIGYSINAVGADTTITSYTTVNATLEIDGQTYVDGLNALDSFALTQRRFPIVPRVVKPNAIFTLTVVNTGASTTEYELTLYWGDTPFPE